MTQLNKDVTSERLLGGKFAHLSSVQRRGDRCTVTCHPLAPKKAHHHMSVTMDLEWAKELHLVDE